MKKGILLLLLISLGTVSCWGKERINRGIVKMTFVPKGQWFFGGTCSYSEMSQENYKLLVLKDLNGNGYQLAIKPFIGYMVKDDLGVGATFAYERSLFKVDNLNMRLFMNIEESKRFGLFNDVKLMFGGGQGKYINGKGDLLEGTYQTIFKTGLIYSPGIAVFINDYAAVEASIGVLGIQMKQVNQKTNGVHTGSFKNSSANFKIDLFSIGLGFSIYL